MLRLLFQIISPGAVEFGCLLFRTQYNCFLYQYLFNDEFCVFNNFSLFLGFEIFFISVLMPNNVMVAAGFPPTVINELL
jgi:hypothetical protein